MHGNVFSEPGKSKISIGNSTVVLLGNGGIFTGIGEDINQHSAISIIIKTDQDSAADGLSLEWSPDNVNWDHIQTHTITANVTFTSQAMVEAKFFRIVYTNGVTPQGSLRLQILLLNVPSVSEIQQLKDIIDDTADAQLVRAVISGKTPAGPYINLGATNGGNLKFSLEELESAISSNGNAQLNVTLFDVAGDALDIDPRSSSLGSISVEHKRIHGEVSYFHCSFADLATATSRQFILSTPDTTTRIHFVFQVEFEKESTVTLTEAVSTTSDGTAITEVNRERNSGNSAALVLTHTPNTPVGGTIISLSRKGDNQKSGGLSRSENEIILKQNTKYLLDISNESAQNSLTNWEFNWYEEIP